MRPAVVDALRLDVLPILERLAVVPDALQQFARLGVELPQLALVVGLPLVVVLVVSTQIGRRELREELGRVRRGVVAPRDAVDAAHAAARGLPQEQQAPLGCVARFSLGALAPYGVVEPLGVHRAVVAPSDELVPVAVSQVAIMISMRELVHNRTALAPQSTIAGVVVEAVELHAPSQVLVEALVAEPRLTLTRVVAHVGPLPRLLVDNYPTARVADRRDGVLRETSGGGLAVGDEGPHAVAPLVAPVVNINNNAARRLAPVGVGVQRLPVLVRRGGADRVGGDERLHQKAGVGDGDDARP